MSLGSWQGWDAGICGGRHRRSRAWICQGCRCHSPSLVEHLGHMSTREATLSCECNIRHASGSPSSPSPIWHKFLNELEHWLTNKHTHRALQRNILQNLKAWHDDRPSTTTPSDWPGITNLVHQQHQAGWTSFFTGFLTDGWADTQQAYYVFLKNVIPAHDGQANLFTNFG